MTPAHQQGYQQRARRARAWALAATTALVAGTLISAPAHAATIARAPVAPSNFTLSATTETTIGLTWTDASNNETRFEVLHQSGTIRTAATNQNSGVWTGLQPDTWNCFRIRAVNAAGASAWQPAATPYWRCARTPTVLEDNYIAFPLQPRTRAHIGDFGLHAGQFRAVTDDNGAGTFTFTNLTGAYSLDFVPDPAANAGIYAVEDGVVKAIQKRCNVVIVDGGDGQGGGGAVWSVYVHIVPAPALRTGQVISASTRLGTMMPVVAKPPCGQVYPVEHVHLAMAIPTSANSAGYTSLGTQSFCGHRLIQRNASNTDLYLDGLTVQRREVFTVPPPC